MTHARQGRGRLGETAAAEALTAAGYVIVERRWRCRHGELDVVARDGETWCFVEVKAVRHEAAGSPFEKVTAAKQRQIARAAAAFLQERGLGEPPCRFDVVGVWLDAGDRVARTEIRAGAFELG